MKVLFTADLHIKLGQRNVPKEWQKSRYTDLLNYIEDISKEVDLVILGGDIFDSRPSVEEIAIYVDLVACIKSPCIIFDGNHEACRKGETWLKHLSRLSTLVNSKVKVVDFTTTLFGIQFLPYCRLKKELKTLSPESNILVTHVRGAIEPYVKPEVDLELFDKWDFVFAGDLHAHNNSQRNIVYPGSPLTTSFHRKHVDTGVIIFDTDNPKNYEFRTLTLPQLIRKTVENESEIKASSYDHTIYELKGSSVDMASTVDHTLLDKKIITKQNEAVLDLSASKSKEDEISTYCSEILNLGEDEIKDIITMYLEGSPYG